MVHSPLVLLTKNKNKNKWKNIQLIIAKQDVQYCCIMYFFTASPCLGSLTSFTSVLFPHAVAMIQYRYFVPCVLSYGATHVQALHLITIIKKKRKKEKVLYTSYPLIKNPPHHPVHSSRITKKKLKALDHWLAFTYAKLFKNIAAGSAGYAHFFFCFVLEQQRKSSCVMNH